MPNSCSRRNRSNNSTLALLSKPPLAPAPQVEGRLVTPGGVGQHSPAHGGHHSIAKPPQDGEREYADQSASWRAQAWRRCGPKLTVRYSGVKHNIPRYACHRGQLDNGEPRCIAFGGLRVDDAI